MINNLMYIELKTGYSDDGPAWIGYVKTSKSRMACQVQAVFRPSYSPVYSLLWEASFVHNTQFTIHLCPVADRTGPFLCSFKCGKIQCL